MSVEVFQIVLWGGTGLLVAALCGCWWRGDVRARRDAELGRRWASAVLWNADAAARVARVGSGIAWLDDGDGEIAVRLPERLTAVAVGWYLHIAGWTGAPPGRGERSRSAAWGRVRALHDRLMGRGGRKPGLVRRLLG